MGRAEEDGYQGGGVAGCGGEPVVGDPGIREVGRLRGAPFVVVMQPGHLSKFGDLSQFGRLDGP